MCKLRYVFPVKQMAEIHVNYVSLVCCNIHATKATYEPFRRRGGHLNILLFQIAIMGRLGHPIKSI